MYIYFYVLLMALFLATYLHVKSVEHTKLKETYGEAKGVRRGKWLGIFSGVLESICLVGLWLSPQPTTLVQYLGWNTSMLMGRPIAVSLAFISIPLIVIGAMLGLRGIMTTGFGTASYHSAPKKLITTGVYSIVRHPQYLGWLFSHLGVSIFISANYALFFTPVLIIIIYIISRAEEIDLLETFGEQYKDYKKRVPMLFPYIRARAQ